QSNVDLIEWRELLLCCVSPSVFMTPEFMLPALEHLLYRKEKAKTLVIRKQSNQKLVALFFFRNTRTKWKLLQFDMAEYSIVDEIDKPYPLIHAKHENSAWELVMDYFLSCHKQWDILDFMELIPSSPIFQKTSQFFNLPLYFTIKSMDTYGPIIDMQQSWCDFFSKHKKIRQKIRKINKDFGDDFEFKIYSGTEVKIGIEEYIKVEQKSWKAKNNIGISKDSKTITFYQQFLGGLAKTNSVFFGFIYIRGEPVSGEIAYTHGENIYFSHGAYNPEYQKYSPGMVSTALFIKSFCDQGYKNGDFLTGYAKYINPWAKKIIKTERLTILKLSLRMIFVLILVGIKKILWQTCKKRKSGDS
ncbi:MAG: GNAT family N-acetyltransferase, partial [Pseudomonadota bacterium]